MDKKDKIEAAKRLVHDEGIMSLLSEVMLNPDNDRINPQVLLSKSDEEIGQITRADLMAEDKVKYRFNTIKNLATQGGEAKPAAKS